MKIPVEEIISRCEGVYQLSQQKTATAPIEAYGATISGFLDVCLLFEDISQIIFTDINGYYKDKFDGIQREPHLGGYDLSKIKVTVINGNNNKGDMKIL